MNGTRHTGTSVAVYKDLKEQILHLELPPGSAISEIDTAAAFHVSRTPVRDAFKMLEREGLLEVRPHIGTFVSLIDLNMISDILYLRETLEQAVLRDLTAGYDKSQEFRIRLLLQRQCELLEQDLPAEELGRAFIINDNEFHNALRARRETYRHGFSDRRELPVRALPHLFESGRPRQSTAAVQRPYQNLVVYLLAGL